MTRLWTAAALAATLALACAQAPAPASRPLETPVGERPKAGGRRHLEGTPDRRAAPRATRTARPRPRPTKPPLPASKRPTIPAKAATQTPPPSRRADLRRQRPNPTTIWDRLAQCESGGDWHINTGNGFYGGVQFSLSSWRYAGGTGKPHHHTRAEQIRRAQRLLELQGWGAWPACSRKLGLR